MLGAVRAGAEHSVMFFIIPQLVTILHHIFCRIFVLFVVLVDLVADVVVGSCCRCCCRGWSLSCCRCCRCCAVGVVVWCVIAVVV